MRRDNGKRENVSEGRLSERVEKLLDEMQKDMLAKAENFLKSRIEGASNFAELKRKLKEGNIVKVYMKDSAKIEAEIEDNTGGAVSRIIEEISKEGKCIVSGEKVKTIGYIAKAY